jgi:nifR3 family TIM-barrel protein
MVKKKIVEKNFWLSLKRPIMALAPMADVTDAAFRQMFCKYGKPDVMFTELVSVDGLCSVGRKNVSRELIFAENERPVVAQLWGTDPAKFRKAAAMVAKMGFDGIDLNMGCPQEREVRLGGGAALINTPDLARAIIKQTKLGAGGLPVSVKTRIGYNKIELEGWLTALLASAPAAITLHARTKKEMSRVPAHWEDVTRAVKIRDRLKSPTLILGNGDVKSLAEAKARAKETGADGVMVGRGVFGNPWFFNPKVKPEAVTAAMRLKALLEHAQLFIKIFGRRKNFVSLRKHFKAYASGFDGARELRIKLMATEDLNQTKSIIKEFLKNIRKE